MKLVHIETKTRFLIIIGFVVGVIMALIIGVLNYDLNGNPAFHSNYPQISQNDMYCWTQWWYMQNTVLDEEKLISSLRSTISGFDSDFDIPDREIIIKHNDEKTIISIGGSWAKDKPNYEKLTSVIKDHMGDSKIISDDIVICT